MQFTREQHLFEILRFRKARPAPLFGGRRCCARYPGRRFTCTLRRGHAGLHVAHGWFGTVVAAWDDRRGFQPLYEVAYEGEPSWSTVHFPFLCHYARAIERVSPGGGKPSNDAAVDALESALKDAGFETRDEGARRDFVSSGFRDGETFKDRETVRRHARERFGTERAVLDADDRLGRLYREPDVGTRVRLVIARLIEARFGEEERSKYVVAMFIGEAP